MGSRAHPSRRPIPRDDASDAGAPEVLREDLRDREAAALEALACVLYIGGGFMVTFLVNVPMNEELARVGEVDPAALAQVRAGYEGPWNFWNGVRTLFSSLAFVALIGAGLLRRSD